MTKYSAAQDRDANRQTISSNEAFLTRKTATFDGAAGNGAVGTADLFTVTGDVLVKLYAVVGTTLEGATATIRVGVSGNTTSLLPQTTATDLTAGTSWSDSTPVVSEQPSNDSPDIIGGGLDIIATVATADITAGSIKFYAVWRPLSSDGNVVAA